jgi:hypothetical protein
LDARAGKRRKIRVKPADPSYYSVDGLFTIIREELAQLDTDRPFGRPKGTSVILKFLPDEKLGYPKRYLRDAVGSTKGLAIEVIRLDRVTTGASVPPAPEINRE